MTTPSHTGLYKKKAIPTAVMLVSLLHTQFPGSEDAYNGISRLLTCVSCWALGGSGYETSLGTGQLYPQGAGLSMDSLF